MKSTSKVSIAHIKPKAYPKRIPKNVLTFDDVYRTLKMCKAYIVNNVLTEDIVFTDMQQILIKYIDKKGEPPRQAFLLELNKKDKSLTYEVVEGVINVKDHKQKTVDLIEPLVTIKL